MSEAECYTLGFSLITMVHHLKCCYGARLFLVLTTQAYQSWEALVLKLLLCLLLLDLCWL
jgi:hypothetical protein